MSYKLTTFSKILLGTISLSLGAATAVYVLKPEMFNKVSEQVEQVATPKKEVKTTEPVPDTIKSTPSTAAPTAVVTPVETNNAINAIGNMSTLGVKK